MNFLVTVAMTSWSTLLPWPAVITSVGTVSLYGGSPRRRMSAQSAGRSGKAFLKSTYCWGMLLIAVPYQWVNVWYSGCFIHISQRLTGDFYLACLVSFIKKWKVWMTSNDVCSYTRSRHSLLFHHNLLLKSKAQYKIGKKLADVSFSKS